MLLRIGLILFPLGTVVSLFLAAYMWDAGIRTATPRFVLFGILMAVMSKRVLDAWDERRVAAPRKVS